LPRPNLLKIDDLLLKAGWWLALAWLLGSTIGIAIALDAEEGLARTNAFILAFASAPIGLWIAGFKLRQREHRAWSLYRMVDDHVEIPASDLLRNSDLTAETLSRAIRDLNNAGVAFLVWDRKANLIQDGRLRSARIQVEDCGACGAKVSLNLRIGDIASARCPYCHDPLGAERLMEEKAQLVDELDTDPEIMSARNSPPSNFSIPIFAILTLFFWPLAIGYAFWKWRAGELPF
jgi:hypothetical protein